MGRPLNKRYFGDISVSGSQIVAYADVGTGLEKVSIIRQKGTRTYEVIASGAVSSVTCRLVDNVTKPGEMVIYVFTSGGGVEHAYTLTSHRVKTYEGNDYPWTFNPPMDEWVEVDNA